jgi:hypothetical protein
MSSGPSGGGERKPSRLTDHHRYQEKVVSNPTTARVLLMFLRDFVELRSLYTQWTQNCPCPMMRCGQNFNEPLQLIEHLLSCPELPKGEFKCWKCSSAHTFPTSEWPVWKGHPGADVQQPLQRKRSLSDKVSKVFDVHRRRRSSVDRTAGHQCPKHQVGGAPFEWNAFTDTQLRRQLDPNGSHVDGGMTQEMQNACGLACVFGTLQGALQGQGLEGQIWPECPTPATDASKMDRSNVPWAEIDEEMDLSSTASLYESTNATTASSGASRSSLTTYTPSLGHGQGFHHHPMIGHDGTLIPGQQYLPGMLSPQSAVDNASNSSAFGAPSPQSPLSRGEEIYSNMLSPVDQTDCDATQQWWGSRQGLMGLSPVPPQQGSPFVPTSMSPAEMASPVHMPMPGVVPRTVGQELAMPPASAYDIEAAQNGQFGQAPRVLPYTCPTHNQPLYEVTGPESNGLQVFSPPGSDHPMGNMDDDCPEELVCDQCNWKPRGVRENLKGYLRKHKNTHKNLRFPCDVPGCTKDFGRQDNLKAHKRDKHHIDDANAASVVASTAPPSTAVSTASSIPSTTAQAVAGGPLAAIKTEAGEQPTPPKHRSLLPEHAMLWGLNY